MRKFTRTEGAPEVVSPEAHRAIQTELQEFSKTSARELSEAEREQLRFTLDQSESA